MRSRELPAWSVRTSLGYWSLLVLDRLTREQRSVAIQRHLTKFSLPRQRIQLVDRPFTGGVRNFVSDR
jgi:hypothetical protein